MHQLHQHLQNQLDKRRASSTFRQLPPTALATADFCSNDYLGLARIAQLFPPTPSNQLGATGSRLLSGNTPLAEQLEQEIANFHRAPSGLLFNSGYSANLGLLSCIAGRHDTILFDRLVHNSIRNGIQLSKGRALGFRHNNLKDLENKLKKSQGNLIIVVESLYSMDGDQAPLEKLVEIATAYDAALIVDEAHATGVCGEQGEGLVVAKGLEQKAFARVHTFGKAIGSQGAIVLGSPLLREYLINFAASFIYTTALPSYNLLHVQAAYRYLQTHPELIQQLQQNIQLFHKSLHSEIATIVPQNDGPIQFVPVAGREEVKRFARSLNERGYDVRPIVPPTVPEGGERIRICMHAFNTAQEIEGLTKSIEELLFTSQNSNSTNL